ncbi:hypothetical protein LB553_12720 [Mesorhizobium sp. CA8]|uniref:hypothetical protein n=1 Tax=Mesorhizobium sp. CA8 TaxID=2876637 RepID=UPI001CCF8949|nr:hypothetical protein [Mesorhizobium sp. CA8]MBZ9761730.1 hypothetical protein [Mesorhizobium sp. CA8]
MAHEETADLLRSARPKILQNSIFRQDKETEIEFCKNFGRVLPRQGLAAKADGRLYERHNGNGSGQPKGANTHYGRPVQRCGYRSRASERSITMSIHTLHSPVPGRFKRMTAPSASSP